jgi:hypothetical protein
MAGRAIVFAAAMLCAGVSIMSTAHTQTPPPPADAALDRFIFDYDPYTGERVPRNLPVAEVVRFIQSRVNAATELRPLLQVEKVADFYDLHEAAEHLKGFVTALEGPDLRRAIVAARTIARVGSPADLAGVSRYFTELASRANSTAEIDELLWLYDAVGGDAAPLRAGIQKRMDELDAARRQNHRAELEFRTLEELRDLRLSRAEKAAGVKDSIRRIADRGARIEREIRIYLTLEPAFPEYLRPWSARRLRRETWAPQPEQQTLRAENPALRAELAEAFRRAEAALAAAPNLSEGNRDSLRVRCLRAVLFFGGSISREEQAFVSRKAGQQFDILSPE